MTPTRWALLTVVVTLVAAFFLLDLQQYLQLSRLQQEQDALLALRREHPITMAVACFALYTALTVLMLPVTALMTLLVGALFGMGWGLPIAALGASLGACGAFLLARYLFRDALLQRLGARADTFHSGVERDGGYYLFSLRLIPVVPFGLINAGMGLTQMRMRTFFWVTLLGLMPATLVYVNAGAQLAEVQSPRDVLSPGLLTALVLLGITPLILRKLTARLLPRRS